MELCQIALESNITVIGFYVGTKQLLQHFAFPLRFMPNGKEQNKNDELTSLVVKAQFVKKADISVTHACKRKTGKVMPEQMSFY